MMIKGSVDSREFKKLNERVKKMTEGELDQFYKETAKDAAGRLLRKVAKRTPVGQYPASTGKVGGTLRRGWDAQNQDLSVKKKLHGYYITIKNTVDYASYVEFGHRLRGGSGWWEGYFFLTKSEQEIEAILPALIARRLKNKLRELGL